MRRGRRSSRSDPEGRSRAATSTSTVSAGGGASVRSAPRAATAVSAAAISRRRRRSWWRTARSRRVPAGVPGTCTDARPGGRPPARLSTGAVSRTRARCWTTGCWTRSPTTRSSRAGGALSDEDDDGAGGRRSRGRGGRVRAAVGAVEARALEHHAHGVEELAQPAVALGADGQRVLAEALELLEGVAALGAGVLVGRHVGPLAATVVGIGRAGATRWHSGPSTANGTAQWSSDDRACRHTRLQPHRQPHRRPHRRPHPGCHDRADHRARAVRGSRWQAFKRAPRAVRWTAWTALGLVVLLLVLDRGVRGRRTPSAAADRRRDRGARPVGLASRWCATSRASRRSTPTPTPT